MRPLRRLGGILLVGLLLAAAPAKREALQPGLVATYTGGEGRTVFRVVPAPRFTLSVNETIDPRVPTDFVATYDGIIRILKESTYTFRAEGGGDVSIDGQPADTLTLKPGDHTLRLTHRRQSGPARLQLKWSAPEFPEEPIPPAALGHRQTPPVATSTALWDRGRLLVQDLNCVACHAGGNTLTGRPAPDLSTAGDRLRPEWIAKWLANPKQFRTHATMPVVLKDERDRRDATAYLATLKDPKAEPPKLDPTPELARNGQALFESVGCVQCHHADGPALNGQASKWTSPGQLARYLTDPLATDPSGRMPNMLLDQSQADALAAFLFTGGQQKNYAIHPHLPNFEAAHQPGDAIRGRQLVRQSGCLNCHTIAGETSELPAPRRIDQLTDSTECRAVTYAVPAEDQAAIGTYLSSIAKQPEVVHPAPAYAYEQHVKMLNCAACHAADGQASPTITIDAVPPLSLAGQKLRPAAIERVLFEKERVRPWVKARMPHFGPAVKNMAREILAASGMPPTVDEPPGGTPQQIAEGRRLVGAGQGGLSCITCHAVGGRTPPAPEQSWGPDLTTMAGRLRDDWFFRWVREPGRIVHNSVMPSFFAAKPLDNARREIAAIHAFLSLGKGMPTPNGANQTGQTKFLLTAIDAPLVQRCFLKGGGVDGKYDPIPRAVAVGLPGGLSYAFDPESVQTRYVWTGGFLDMTAGWNGRGNSHGHRTGTPFYNFPTGPLIYVGSLGQRPTIKYHGYAISPAGVEITYDVSGVEVRERIDPAPQIPGFSRTLTFGPTEQAIHVLYPDDPRFHTKPTTGTFNTIDALPGWDAGTKARVLKTTGGQSVTVTFTPAAEAK